MGVGEWSQIHSGIDMGTIANAKMHRVWGEAVIQVYWGGTVVYLGGEYWRYG